MARPSIATLTAEDPPSDRREWSVVVAGDTIVERPTPPTVGDALQETITDGDLSLVNLEAPIAGDGDPIDKTGPVNQAVPETPSFLRELGFDAVTLANNHAMDYGSTGLRNTVESCTEAGLASCGAGQSPAEAIDPLRTTVAGQSVTVFDVCEREFGAATHGNPGTAWSGHPELTDRISDAAASSDVLVVVAHGGVEYLPLPPPTYRRQLRGYAEAGADLVVGHHPHVPQGWEQYSGTPICYSLGNFRYKRGTRPKTEWGLLLEATFAGDTLSSMALRPLERRGDGLAFMGERWDVSSYRSYVERTSEITGDQAAYRAHWQELAVRVFEQRYGPWLRTAAGSDILSILRHPFQYLHGDQLWDGDARESELLTLLNLVRNESHRDVVETAMAVKTGDRSDRRTVEVRDQVADLLAVTEDRRVYDRPSALGQLLEAATARLRGAVSPERFRLGYNSDRP